MLDRLRTFFGSQPDPAESADALRSHSRAFRARQSVNLRGTRWATAASQGYGPADRTWVENYQASVDALDAYRTNPLARNIVRLVAAYTLGDTGLQVTSAIPEVNRWIKRFWAASDMDTRLIQFSDALCIDGEVFPVLYPSGSTGQFLVRARPRICIDAIDFDLEDYERELRYHERPISYSTGTAAGVEKWWPSSAVASLAEPVMLHYAVNRPIGAVRGEGDLVPLLPWLRRYSDWLFDRAKLNKYRGRFYWDVTLSGASDEEIAEAQERYSSPPSDGSIIVHSDKETWTAVSPKIESGDARFDGRALQQMIAAGSGQPPHWFGDVESGTRATAESSAAPAFRILVARQKTLVTLSQDLVTQALTRAHLSGHFHDWPHDGDLQLATITADLTREDNLALAQAAYYISVALESAVQQGWLDADTARLWLARFAGEEEPLTAPEQPPTVQSKPAGTAGPTRPGRIHSPNGKNEPVQSATG